MGDAVTGRDNVTANTSAERVCGGGVMDVMGLVFIDQDVQSIRIRFAEAELQHNIEVLDVLKPALPKWCLWVLYDGLEEGGAVFSPTKRLRRRKPDTGTLCRHVTGGSLLNGFVQVRWLFSGTPWIAALQRIDPVKISPLVDARDHVDHLIFLLTENAIPLTMHPVVHCHGGKVKVGDK